MKSALVFGYNQNEDGSLVPQTRSRCDKAVQLYKTGTIDHIYLTCNPQKGGVYMADAMALYLQANGVAKECITVSRRGGNTAGELAVLRELLPEKSELFLVSSWYHLARILFLARVHLKDIRVSGIAAESIGIHLFGDVCMELPKTINSLLRPRSSAKVLRTDPAHI